MKRALLILLLIASGLFAAEPPEQLVVARRDFTIKPGGDDGLVSVDVKRGEQFVGKIYANEAKIKWHDLWLKVSRNDVSTIGANPNAPIRQ